MMAVCSVFEPNPVQRACWQITCRRRGARGATQHWASWGKNEGPGPGPPAALHTRNCSQPTEGGGKPDGATYRQLCPMTEAEWNFNRFGSFYPAKEVMFLVVFFFSFSFSWNLVDGSNMGQGRTRSDSQSSNFCPWQRSALSKCPSSFKYFYSI